MELIKLPEACLTLADVDKHRERARLYLCTLRSRYKSVADLEPIFNRRLAEYDARRELLEAADVAARVRAAGQLPPADEVEAS